VNTTAPRWIGLIVALTAERVIGLHGGLPWNHRGDLRRFKERTLGATMIMGRLTFESMGSRPLPGRRNVVLTSRALPGVECFASLDAALAACSGDVWVIGGARVFEEALGICDEVDLTHVPDTVDHPDAVRFPPIDPDAFEPGPRTPHPYNPALEVQILRRRGAPDRAAEPGA
jgi:dihydrofolate reductase